MRIGQRCGFDPAAKNKVCGVPWLSKAPKERNLTTPLRSLTHRARSLDLRTTPTPRGCACFPRPCRNWIQTSTRRHPSCSSAHRSCNLRRHSSSSDRGRRTPTAMRPGSAARETGRTAAVRASPTKMWTNSKPVSNWASDSILLPRSSSIPASPIHYPLSASTMQSTNTTTNPSSLRPRRLPLLHLTAKALLPRMAVLTLSSSPQVLNT